MVNANMVNVQYNNFNNEVVKSSVPVLVDFWAPWCGPCRAVAPILEQLAVKYEGQVKIGKLNVDEEPELASQFRVMSIPTLILLKNGEIVQKMVGLRSVQELEEMLKKAM